MTSLDASALTTDPEGLEFLAAVLETSPFARPAAGAFEIGAIRQGWSMNGGESDASRSGFDLRVSEAA